MINHSQSKYRLLKVAPSLCTCISDMFDGHSSVLGDSIGTFQVNPHVGLGRSRRNPTLWQDRGPDATDPTRAPVDILRLLIKPKSNLLYESQAV